MKNVAKKRIYRITILGFIIILIGWMILKFISFKTTINKIPYTNLKDFRNSSCYIFFNIEYKGEKDIVVFENSKMFSRMSIKNKLITIVYPVWLSEKIKNNKSIKIDESLFTDFKWFIVKPNLIQKYFNHDILNDTSLVKNNYLTDLSQDEQNAVIYILLKKGINCCPSCESGFIKITP